MSASAAEAALHRMETDEDFAARVRDAGGAAASIAVLQAEGFDTTPEEMRDALVDRFGDSMTEEQLAALAGGNSMKRSGWASPLGSLQAPFCSAQRARRWCDRDQVVGASVPHTASSRIEPRARTRWPVAEGGPQARRRPPHPHSQLAAPS
ncbi:MAG: hypothetical protein ACRD2W_13500 [Acidimicrobiales bacterium]